MFPNLGTAFADYFLKSVTDSLRHLDGQINPDFPTYIYASLISAIQQDMNHFAISILQAAIHSLDLAFRNSPQRLVAYHVRGNPVRTLCTPFGDITFQRTLYNDKHDKSHLFCFVDHVLGIPKYIQYDPCIRSLVFAYSLRFNSMQKVGEVVGDLIRGFSLGLKNRKHKAISKQTVANILHAAPNFSLHTPKMDHTPHHLYIMSDEKYKSLQGVQGKNGKAKKVMIKMAIIFEGVEQHGQRRKLINPYTVIGLGEDFWQKVIDVLEERYDMDKVSLITSMGDGASWIYSSLSELKTSTTNVRFLLDAFHAKQAINRISTKQENRELLAYYLINNNIKEFKYLVDMIKKDKKPERVERIKKQYKYIQSRWDNAVAIFQSEIGCPMESHIEHNLATLISSVPKAYSKSYLSKLIKFIAHDKNGEDMQELYLKSLTMPKNDDTVTFDAPMDLSMFDQKPDNYDKSSSTSTMSQLLHDISIS